MWVGYVFIHSWICEQSLLPLLVYFDKLYILCNHSVCVSMQVQVCCCFFIKISKLPLPGGVRPVWKDHQQTKRLTAEMIHQNMGRTWRIVWTENSCHRDFLRRIMDALPSIIPKSIVEVLNRLENDEDNLFSWKLTRSQDSFSLTVSCKLRAKTPQQSQGQQQRGHRTYYFCETSKETSTEEEPISLCVGSF